MAGDLPATTFLLLCFLLSISTLPALLVAAGGGFSVELIHRDSPNSPYYDPSATTYDLVRAATRRSTSRADYFLRRSLSKQSSPSSSFQSNVIPDNFLYLMNVSIGTPPINHLLIVDTATNIIWTKCKGYSDHKATIFDPSNSSTYRVVTCDSSVCDARCNHQNNTCVYGQRYRSTAINGTFSWETFRFGNVSIPKVIFGCSYLVDGPIFEDTNMSSGVASLGRGRYSLISQLNPTIEGKFSYCLVPYFSNASTSSLLSFGDKAIVGGQGAVSIPLISDFDLQESFYVTLEDIIVGSSSSPSSSSSSFSFSSSSPLDYNTNFRTVNIDSGTTFSYVDIDMADKVEEQVAALVKLPRVEMEDFSMCFDASNMSSSSNNDLPDMIFRFTGGDLKLSPLNTFVSPKKGVVCLAILSNWTFDYESGIIGNLAQQNFHVGYDLKAGTVTFVPADCANLG